MSFVSVMGVWFLFPVGWFTRFLFVDVKGFGIFFGRFPQEDMWME